MVYPVNIKGFENQNIAVQTAGVFSGQKLLVNGEPAPKGAKRGEMLLHRNDGLEVVARWKPQMLGFDIPQLQVGEETVQFVEPLQWYELVWSGWPILLIFVGGFLGAIAGLIALSANLKLFRSEMSTAIKYVVTMGISIIAIILYLGVAFLISGLLG